jgi:hypothetical protein
VPADALAFTREQPCRNSDSSSSKTSDYRVRWCFAGAGPPAEKPDGRSTAG